MAGASCGARSPREFWASLGWAALGWPSLGWPSRGWVGRARPAPDQAPDAGRGRRSLPVFCLSSTTLLRIRARQDCSRFGSSGAIIAGQYVATATIANLPALA